MQEDLVPVDIFCLHYNIELDFVNALQEFGLIEITIVEDTKFISLHQLNALEKFVRLHYEMGINLEGVDAVTHLLQRLNAMQGEITALKNKLRLYDAN